MDYDCIFKAPIVKNKENLKQPLTLNPSSSAESCPPLQKQILRQQNNSTFYCEDFKRSVLLIIFWPFVSSYFWTTLQRRRVKCQMKSSRLQLHLCKQLTSNRWTASFFTCCAE